MLVTWCIEETERKYGPGRRPFLSQVRKEGFAWSRQGIDTVEAAEAHLKKLAQLRTREREVLRLLDIPGPPPGWSGRGPISPPGRIWALTTRPCDWPMRRR